MTDGELLDAPHLDSAPQHEPPAALEMWRLRRGDHMLICKLSDRRVGVDVLTLDASRWSVLTQRCASQAHAEFVAMSYRRTYLRQGWTEQR